MTEARLEAEIPGPLDGAKEVHVEADSDAPFPGHETVIRTVVADASVRSARGGKGRWYREASANPRATLRATLRVNDRRVPVRTVPETDARTIGEAGGASYPGPAAAAVREEVPATTLRPIPA